MILTMKIVAYSKYILFANLILVFGQDCPNAQQVCYPRAGCFDNCPPFDELPLPMSPDDIGMVFYIYTNMNPTTPETIDEDNLGTVFRPEWGTVFIVHGGAGSPSDPWILALKDELLTKNNYNVITVGWEDGALPQPDDPFTPYPVSNTRVVGAVSATLAASLVEKAGMVLASAHCVGFSAGAHACGFMGKNITGLGRISGLDPAGPIFDNMTDTVGHLWRTDANVVDIIHTNSFDYFINSGSSRQLGDIDFWANQGKAQPGCAVGVCSHFRVVDLYVESVNSQCPFTARPCSSVDDMLNDNCGTCSGDTCQYMGYNSILYPGRGNFVLSTNAVPPFCQN